MILNRSLVRYLLNRGELILCNGKALQELAPSTIREEISITLPPNTWVGIPEAEAFITLIDGERIFLKSRKVNNKYELYSPINLEKVRVLLV